MNPNSVIVTMTLKIATHFLHVTLWLIMMYHHTELQKVQRFISSKLSLIEMLTLADIDLEHSNPIFSLDTSLFMMIYHQIESGWKRLTGLEIIKDIVETISF